MSKQKNYEVIRENELGYLQTGDYFIPDLKAPTGESFYRKIWSHAS